MITLIGEPEDNDLLWLAAALRRRGQDIDVVLPDEIVGATSFVCRVDRAGVSSSVRLRDGRTLAGSTPRLVINRLAALPPRPATSAVDAAYLDEEWRAALVAWLRSLPCPVLNPPRAASLSGPVLTRPAWLDVASALGLPTQAWTSEGDMAIAEPADVFVVGDTCLDLTHPASPTAHDRLRQLSRLVGAPLMRARFDRADGWRFAEATAFPPLADGGQPLVDAIIELATSRASVA